MPVIPQFTRQVQEQDTPIVRQPMNATPDAYGAGMGQALSHAGAQVSAIAAKEQEVADTNAVLDASEMFSNKMLDKQSELMSRKGSLANGVSAELEKFYQDESAKVVATLKNKNQVAGFRVRNRTNMFNFMRNIKTHERNEKEAYADERDEARDKTNTALALAAPDAETLDGVVQTGLLDIRNAGASRGKPPETIAARESKFLTGILIGRANIAIDNGAGFDEVREAIRKYGGKADKEKLVDMERKLNKAQNTFNDDAQIEAIIKANTRADGTIDRAGALAAMQGAIGKGASVSAPADAAKYFDGNINGVSGTLVGNMARLAKDKGIKIVVNSGFRTREEQEALYNNRANNPFPVAAPGTSEHENGLAIDTDSLADLSSAELAKYGIKRLEGDEIHYTAMGASGGTSTSPERVRSFEARLKARIADAEWVVSDRVNQYKKDVYGKVYRSNSIQEAMEILQDVDPNIISPDVQLRLIERQTKVLERLSGPLTDEQKMWGHYGKTKYYDDIERVKKFSLMLVDPKYDAADLNDDTSELGKAAKSANAARMMLKAYDSWLHPPKGGDRNYSPIDEENAENKEGPSKQQAAAKNGWWEQQKAEIKSKYPNATDEQITQFLTGKAKQIW